MSQPVPYTLAVPQGTLDWIQSRLETARVVPGLEMEPGNEWSYGLPNKVINDHVQYWKSTYDWRAVEARINAGFRMYTMEVEEKGESLQVHFVHHRSERPNAIPLLFSHGWPGSFLEVEKLLEPLTSPADPTAQAFHVVAPSIPGFALSTSPQKGGFGIADIAATYNKLMVGLGYNQYVAQGGDYGSMITRVLALDHSANCVAAHLNFIFAEAPSALWNPFTLLRLILGRWTLTADQGKRLQRMQWWFGNAESGYSRIMGSKPLTIAYALQDSPVGMLAWIRDKLHPLAEPDFVWDDETVITWTMMYLLPGTANSCAIYKEATSKGKGEFMRVVQSDVLVGASCFPKDVGYIPRWWAEVSLAKNIVFWREHDTGGHFASFECSDALVKDITEFSEAVFLQGGERWKSLLASGK